MARAKQNPRREKAAAKRVSRKAAVKKAKSAAKHANPAQTEVSLSEPEILPPEAILLPETLDASSATEIRNQLLTRRGAPLVVDAGQVRRTGMQAVQILLAAARTWEGDGQSYAVTNPTSEFLDTLALVGLSRERLYVEGISG